MAKGYCVKCKVKDREMKDVSISKTSRGAFMAQGKCSVCGTKMSAMMSKENADKAMKEGAKKNF